MPRSRKRACELELAEWLKAHAWKACLRETVTWVRIPLPPPPSDEARAAIGNLIEKWRKLGHDIGFGIGIAHGFATLGTIGFEGRFDYAAIGTVSNVASLLFDEAKPGQILISPRVLTKVENAVTVEPIGQFELKGIRRPLAAYNVVGIASPAGE